MAQRGRGVHRGEDFAACRLDVCLEPFNLGVRRFPRRLVPSERGGRTVARLLRSGERGAPLLELGTSRRAPHVETAELRFELHRGRAQRLNLLSIELRLLLQTPHLELARVRRFPGAGRLRVRLGQLDPDALQRRLELGQPRRRRRFALTRRSQLRPRRLDRRRERAVARGELDFLPAPELVPQPLVAPRLGRLSFQRAALLLDLVNDVLDTREVLLRRLELQLGRAPPVLVLRDPRRLFDELPAIGRPRAQDLADFPLLDDRIRLHPHACVHEQIVDVAQPADLAVDQILALARAVQPAADLHVANELLARVRLRDRNRDALVFQFEMLGQSPGGVCDAGRFGRRGAAVGIRVTVAVAVSFNAVRLHAGRKARRHFRELQFDFGGAGRLAGVAARENHILHPIAAQAFRALLPEHPGDGVDDIAFSAAVRPDDGGHARVEGQLRAIGKALES